MEISHCKMNKKYQPNNISKKEFTNAIKKMADEVWEFHNRFKVGSGRFKNESPNEIIKMRKTILDEEFLELNQALDNNEDEVSIADEVSDILFVAMGHIESMGDFGISSIENVTKKNSLKTIETHKLREDTGKILPIKGKPHK